MLRRQGHPTQGSLAPGAYKASIGHLSTDELAVMLDTTLPLHPTAAALTVEDPNCQSSFIP